jgi:hypothetical protein
LNTKDYLEYLLKNYLKLKKDLEFLKYKRSCFEGITEEESIDVLTFSQPDGERVSTSNISYKTAKVALIYKKHMLTINRQGLQSIEYDIATLEYELNWLEYAIQRLDKAYLEVIKDLFMTGLTWDDICFKHRICRQTLGKYRRRALKEMIELFDKNGKV